MSENISSALQLFSNGEFELHISHADDGTLRISAPGIARGLAYKDARDMLRAVPSECKGSALARTPGGEQLVWFVTEGGFYRLVGQRQASRIKDLAVRKVVVRFQSWVFDDVLPSLRRTGQYSVPGQRQGGEFFEPNTLTWDETAAVIRQRYGIAMDANGLTRMLRTAGVLKQTGGPRKQYQHLLWFTGSSWNVHPHCVPQIAQHLVTVGRELQEFRFIQARLELDGVGEPPSSDRSLA